MASSDVVVHELLHVVEDVSALGDPESLATTSVSGRNGVVATANDFFSSRSWHEDAVVQPPFSMVEGSVSSWLVRYPRRVSCNWQVECLILLFPVFHGIHGKQRVDKACWARK